MSSLQATEEMRACGGGRVGGGCGVNQRLDCALCGIILNEFHSYL